MSDDHQKGLAEKRREKKDWDTPLVMVVATQEEKVDENDQLRKMA
jgi:hypothetical protein